MEKIEVDKLFDKGVKDEAQLNESELLIYAVTYLEFTADMEGWDHFYTYAMRLYPHLLKMLNLAGDIDSLRVLENYEKHFKDMGVQFMSEDIDRFLTTATNEYLSACPDWRGEFSDARVTRWQSISQYFRGQGIEIKT